MAVKEPGIARHSVPSRAMTSILLFLILIIAGERSEALATSDDEVTDNNKVVKDPIINIALKIFQSLENFKDKHSGHNEESKAGHHRNENNDKYEASNSKVSNVEYPRKYILVKDYQTVLGYQNIEQEQEHEQEQEQEQKQEQEQGQEQLTIRDQSIKEDQTITVAPFHFKFRFFTENTSDHAYDMNDEKQERIIEPEKVNLSGEKSVKGPKLQLPQMQVLGQSVEMDSFWDFDREIGV